MQKITTTLLHGAVLATMLVSPVSLVAEETELSAIVLTKDGSEYVQPLSNIKRISVGSDKLYVYLNKGSRRSFEYTDIDRINLDYKTALSQIVEEEGCLAVWPSRAESTVTVAGAGDGATITLYNLAGATALQPVKVTGTDPVTIDVTPLQPGVYILNAGEGRSVKFIKL